MRGKEGVGKRDSGIGVGDLVFQFWGIRSRRGFQKA